MLATMLVAQIGSIREETQTWDEATLLAAGYSYWKTGDYRMNRAHPPLWKLACAFPLLFLDLRVPLDDPSWEKRDDTAFGTAFLYHNRRSSDDILFPARCVTIALSLGLAVLVALWTKRRAGTLAGLIALTLVAFDPNILAHGRYVTTDLAAAAFSFLACILWESALGRPTSLRFLAAGLALGVAVAVKFSALFVLPVCLVLTLLRPPPPKALARGLSVAFAALVALLLACYRGAGSVYLDGLHELAEHNATGHESYLLGTISSSGWRYYFPVAFAVKVPFAVLLLGALAAWALWRKRGDPRAHAVLIVPLVIFAAIALFTRIDIGIRHLLPLFPFLYAGLAIVLARRVPAALVALGLFALVAESLAVYPNYLAFFNLAAGGPARGPLYLLDSNIDWGQATKKLRAWLDAHGNPRVCGAYFGNALPAYYGIDEAPVPASARAAARTGCVVAVSVTPLYGLYAPGDPYRWLRAHEPLARVGYSIYVYDFRAGRVSLSSGRGGPDRRRRLSLH
ncbi:MAG TPA: phospholipid carrier-dependent glycosyltransferase [Candidatus Baltobacteraceae bacterium]|nr:phospholipid carrier-dependent glycosyltransferase [Candidatus Baltobacteraceae bacterium]